MVDIHMLTYCMFNGNGGAVQSLRRAGKPLLAQVLWSLGQMSVTVAGAVALEPTTWGRLAILLAVFFTMNGFVRGLATLPIVVHHSNDLLGARRDRRAGMTTAVIACVPAAFILTATGAALGAGALGAELAVAMLTYSMYDTARSVECSGGEWDRVIRSDAVVMVVLIAGSGLAVVSGVGSPTAIVGSMGSAYAVGSAMVLRRTRVDAPRSLRSFVAAYRRDMPFLAADGVVLGLTMTAFVGVLGATGSVAAAGAFRTATTVFAGPVQMALSAMSPVVIRTMRRDARLADPATERRWPSMRRPMTIAGWSITAALAVGAAAQFIAGPVLGQVGPESLAASAYLAFAACGLVAALWSTSVFSAFMRYRCSSAELTLVRITSLALSTCALGASLSSGLDLPFALGLAAVPWVVIPAGHLVFRWRRVQRAGEARR
jgi:hypothetical protein